MNIFVVGCGAVGSQFAVEMAKRLYANGLHNSVSIHLYDFDTVESRNCAAQVYSPSQIGMTKVAALHGILSDFVPSVTKHPIKVDSKTVIVTNNDAIFVDAVDDLMTRRHMCERGIVAGVPVLHLAMNEGGEGQVTWSTKWTDSFPLGPLKMTQAKAKELAARPKPEIPPCELSYMRGIIFNTAFSGVCALWQALGMDNYADEPAICSYLVTNTQVSQIAYHPLDEPLLGSGGDDGTV